MNVLFAFAVLVSALALVRCQEYRHKESKEPHHFNVIGNCSPHRNKLRENKINATLKARERHVILNPDPGFEFDPVTVSVKRCIGQCTNRRSPMPTKTEIKQFIVHRKLKGNSMSMQCGSVDVVEHTACKCECMMTDRDCDPKKQLDSSSCDCVCKERKKLRTQCESKVGMEWHDSTCSCLCTDKIMECASGGVWNKEICDCMRA